jgi:hypothetical protein
MVFSMERAFDASMILTLGCGHGCGADTVLIAFLAVVCAERNTPLCARSARPVGALALRVKSALVS